MQLRTDITKTTFYPDTLTSLVMNSKNQNVDQLLENMFNFFYEVMDYDSNSFWISNLSDEDCVVTLTKNGSPKDIYIECMIGLERIVLDTISDLSFTIPANSKAYIRSDNSTFSSSSSNYYKFLFDKQCNIGGNLMSLVGERELTDYMFFNLFAGNTNLVDASQLLLPATTLAESCYEDMFNGCTSLTTAPEILPATTLASSCYDSMFYRCTSLTTAPELPATTLADYCYNAMFYGCTSLTTAPELPATTLAWGCYASMFSGCTNLNYVKALFTTTPGFYTFNWLSGVATSGTFVKNADATWNVTGVNGIPSGWTVKTEAEYFWIESDEADVENTITFGFNCESETISYPVTLEYSIDKTNWTSITLEKGNNDIPLPANSKMYFRGENDTLTCSIDDYRQFVCIYCSEYFNVGGSLISLISLDFDETKMTYPGTFATLFMVNENDATLKHAHKLKLPYKTTISCYDEMFAGCTSLTTAPALPATTLASYCYVYMFCSCISLTTAPELPATELADGCYTCMFAGCTNLNYVKAMFTTTPGNDYTGIWLDGVSSTGTFVKNAAATWDVTGESGIPSGWTVQTATA